MRHGFLVLALVAATLVSTATAHAGPPKVLTQRLHHMFQVRPAWIGYTGDGTGFIGGADGSGAAHPGHLHWARYRHRQASATGVVWLNTAAPTAPTGTSTPAPPGCTSSARAARASRG
jgi:hypothetical protein